MKELLPYIVSVLVAVITGFISYITSRVKAKTDIRTLQEQNKHELERLMHQHALDIESLEKQHKFEIDRLELEHKHNMEYKQKEQESSILNGVLQSTFSEVLRTPDAHKLISEAIKSRIK